MGHGSTEIYAATADFEGTTTFSYYDIYTINFMTSWQGNVFRITGALWPSNRGYEIRSFDIIFVVSLKNRVNQQSCCWFEVP